MMSWGLCSPSPSSVAIVSSELEVCWMNSGVELKARWKFCSKVREGVQCSQGPTVKNMNENIVEAAGSETPPTKLTMFYTARIRRYWKATMRPKSHDIIDTGRGSGISSSWKIDGLDHASRFGVCNLIGISLS